MPLETFLLERNQTLYENEVEINLTESGVKAMTLREACRQLNISPGYLCRIERGNIDTAPSNELLRRILATNTGQDEERIRRDADRNYYLTAQQAVEYGLVDEILHNPTAIT